MDGGVFYRDDERGGVGVGLGGGAEEALLVVRDEQADQGQGDDVEEGDAPEDLLDGGGQRLSRVGRLGSGETDEFRAGEGEGGRDEDATQSLKTVVESAWVSPILAPYVPSLRRAAAVEDNTE